MRQSIPSYPGPEQLVQLIGEPIRRAVSPPLDFGAPYEDAFKSIETVTTTAVVKAVIRPWTECEIAMSLISGLPVMVVTGQPPNPKYRVGIYVFQDRLTYTTLPGDYDHYTMDANSGAHLIAAAWLGSKGITLEKGLNNLADLFEWARIRRGLDLEKLLRFFVRGSASVQGERWWEYQSVKYFNLEPKF